MEQREFSFNSLEELISESQSLGLKLHFSNNIELLKRKVDIGGFTAPNSMAIHPMEGCDGERNGSPGELTKRRYDRFSKGGAGLIWFEAVAVVPEGRANPRQLWIYENNLSEFQKLHEIMIQNAHQEFGKDFTPLCIMQLTHSGRYSKPESQPAPVIACHNPFLDGAQKIAADMAVITDSELEKLEDEYVKAAILAQRAGFDGVDVKGCHRYLNSELLSAYTRKGNYGGSFEGRTRFLLNIVDKIRDRLGEKFLITTRLNIYDGIPYPYGWGVDKENDKKYDLEEPIKLVKILNQKGAQLINLTMGNPYYNPHINRPYDKGAYVPPEHPLVGVERMVNGIGEVQKAVPGITVVGTGYSWMRHFSPYLAAGMIEKGYASMIGYGREGFAYPDFARDIVQNGSMSKNKCCIVCSKCTDLMRAGGTTGCVIKDSKTYAPLYNQFYKK
jgi:2,4-dienoyl-CoA reductase-like NADH-dependent reductase (Old Yellow Enzyme family)